MRKFLAFLRKYSIGLAVPFSILYVGLSLYLYFNQDQFIFYPMPLPEETRVQMQRQPGISPLLLKADDGVTLHGWMHHTTSGASKRPVILYFGGNAEEISYQVMEFGRLSGWTTISLNYRGYGASQGKPSQRNLFRDALTLFDYVATRPDVDPRCIVTVGFSLGTGVATYLASKRPIAGVTLIAPFDSFLNVIKKNYGIFPVRILLKHPFESLPYASLAACPLLCVIAGNDEVIPAECSRRLVAAWKGPAQTIEVQGYNHNSILSWPGLWDTMNHFLSAIKN
ncbi:MAG: alpha/beta fold hydrolase [Acidobacteria bacterium]|nr:alpha/beta fold hydrolase [Acidobacteriota bacterium]MBU4307826.1 alpha/beta fold hydrolase [Acidobacteriota bacterium]MCG2810539.1 alpha/beta fold hydrolase [Candidatus Aminicenantes bacterium]